VVASMGHVRDLPANAKQAGEAGRGLTFGIDVEHDYRPHYIISPQNQTKVRSLRAALAKADEVFIATDEDREGEAIGWHVLEVLQPRVPVKRMAFHEITASAIEHALANTREIDMDLVEAQETRRVLDRLVGYAISPLLWRKIAQGLSAGRVQSVAVRMVVERERERLDFVPAPYWDLTAQVRRAAREAMAEPLAAPRFAADLTHVAGVRVASGRDFDDATGRLAARLSAGRDVIVLDRSEAERLADGARARRWQVTAIDPREEARRPAPPFITSTLQQEASRKLGLSARDTMRVAQSLYERGLITYMRTDSTNLAPEARDAIRRTVARRYGADHLPEAPRTYATKSKNAQEAHEAIRPAGTDMRTAEELHLRDREAALYDLIWKRAVASQMADARLRFTTVTMEVTVDEQRLSFRATGRTTLFAGFLRAYVEGSDEGAVDVASQDQSLPELSVGDRIEPMSVSAVGHETKPPARFTEASLVKRLEGEGIGRPSTYASILDTIVQRGYVRKQGSQLLPTFTGFATTQLLEAQFADLVDARFTARMEDDLDEIASGRRARVPYLAAIYAGSEGIASRVTRGLAELDAKRISTIRHPRWEPYAVSVGRYGAYVEGDVDGVTLRASLPDDLVVADLDRAALERALRERNAPETSLGLHDPSGLPMFLRRGPYGHYLQLGGGEGDERPKRVSLPPNTPPEAVDARIAQGLLDLPRALGVHPESGEVIEAHIGRFGPYVRHERIFASLPKGGDPLTVTLPEALALLEKKRLGRGAPRRLVGAHPSDGEAVTLHDGKYGPYVKHGKVNASLPEGVAPDAVTLTQALELLAARSEASGGAPKRAARGGRAAAKASPKKATGAKASAKQATGAKATPTTATKRRSAAPRSDGGGEAPRKAAKAPADKPKATAEDLLPFLGRLAPQDADVTAAVDGIGRTAEALADVAQRLGISVEEASAAARRGRFQLRMAFGRARAL
jgi:DNA topoisomerase I